MKKEHYIVYNIQISCGRHNNNKDFRGLSDSVLIILVINYSSF
jgi:hypothetical protein